MSDYFFQDVCCIVNQRQANYITRYHTLGTGTFVTGTQPSVNGLGNVPQKYATWCDGKSTLNERLPGSQSFEYCVT